MRGTSSSAGLERQRESERRFLNHMIDHGKHPNAWTLQSMEDSLFYGSRLDKRSLALAFRKLFLYMAQDKSRVHRCLHSLLLHERFSPDGEIVEAWLSLESDGTTTRAPKGDRYRLTLNEIKNLWRLIYPYSEESAGTARTGN